MYIRNGKEFDINVQHVLEDGTQCPVGFFYDEYTRIAFQIAEVPDPVWPDARFFHATDNGDGTLAITPKTAEEITQSLASAIADAIATIDRRADDLRYRLAGDPLRMVEYEQAKKDAQAYKDAGYTGPIPATVAAWAVPPRTPQAAADDILLTAAQWTYAMTAIRTIRLGGKEAVRAATDFDGIEAAVNATLAQLAAIGA